MKDYIENIKFRNSVKDWKAPVRDLIKESTNKECKLQEIFPNWGYLIIDSSRVTVDSSLLKYNFPQIMGFKRNNNGNLNIFNAFIMNKTKTEKNEDGFPKLSQFSLNSLNSSLKINFKLYELKDLLMDDNCKLYVINQVINHEKLEKEKLEK